MGKLVRDNVDEEYRDEVRKIDGCFFKQELHRKLIEELLELWDADTPESFVEECADVWEVTEALEREELIDSNTSDRLLTVVEAIALLEGVTLDDIVTVKINKTETRGSFNERWYWEC